MTRDDGVNDPRLMTDEELYAGMLFPGNRKIYRAELERRATRKTKRINVRLDFTLLVPSTATIVDDSGGGYHRLKMGNRTYLPVADTFDVDAGTGHYLDQPMRESDCEWEFNGCVMTEEMSE